MRKFDQFSKQNKELEKVKPILEKANPDDMEYSYTMSGIISKFCIQFDLSWKVLKELLEEEGVPEAQSGSPKVILKEAYRVYDFLDEGLWLKMLNERNHIIHVYEDDIDDLINYSSRVNV